MLDDSHLIAALEAIAEDFPIDAAWLFGSRASGRARPDSDLDCAILFSSPPSPPDLLEVRARLEAGLGSTVDLVDLRRASPILAMQVVRHGRLMFDADRSARARFIASLPSRRYDVVRVRREAEKKLLERMSGG